MSKEFMDRVKKNQEATAAVTPLPVATVKVSVMSNNTVQVERPAGNSPAQLAAVIDILAVGIKIVAQQISEGDQSRIIPVPPGARVQ